MTTPRIAIIGAGPTGLGAAWRLTELGHHRWDLFEAQRHCGGLATSHVDGQGFVWDVGGHVVFSHYAYFDGLLDFLLGDAWIHHAREAWVWMRDRFIPYPFQNNIWRLPKDDLVACLDGLLKVQLRGAERPANFQQWILQNFGQGLADVFMLPYNFKVWAHDPAEISTQWMGERVTTVDLAKVLRNLVLEQDDVSWGPNSTFRFPAHGGTGAIWGALTDCLPRERVHFSSPVARIETAERILVLSDGRRVPYDALISTMPLDRSLAISDCPELAQTAARLKHSSTHVVGVGMEGQPPAALATKCWMYFPEPQFPFYRVTVFSNYSPNNVPQPGRQWSLMAEVSESAQRPVDHRSVVSSTIAGLRAAKLIPDGTQICSTHHQRLEYGYPTPSTERDSILREVLPRLESRNVYSRGRFGAWKYEVANQDHSLMQGVEAVDRILYGVEELTVQFPNAVNAGKNVGRPWRGGQVRGNGDKLAALHFGLPDQRAERMAA